MSKSLKQSNDEKASKVQHKLMHKGKVISLRVDTISNGDSSYTWDIIEHPGAAVIVPVDEQEKFIFVKQWRRAVEKIILEFPAGALEKGEDPLLCANRELQEE